MNTLLYSVLRAAPLVRLAKVVIFGAISGGCTAGLNLLASPSSEISVTVALALTAIFLAVEKWAQQGG